MSISVKLDGHHVLLKNEPIVIGRLNGRTVVPLSLSNLEPGADYIRITGEKACEIFNLIQGTPLPPRLKLERIHLEETIPGAVADDQAIIIGWRSVDAPDRAIVPFQCEKPTSPEDVGRQIVGQPQRITILTGGRLCEYVNAFITRLGNIPRDIVFHHTP